MMFCRHAEATWRSFFAPSARSAPRPMLNSYSPRASQWPTSSTLRALERAGREARRETLDDLLRVVGELRRLVGELRRREVRAAGPAVRRRDAVPVLAVLARAARVLVVARGCASTEPSPSGSGGLLQLPAQACESSQKSATADALPGLALLAACRSLRRHGTRRTCRRRRRPCARRRCTTRRCRSSDILRRRTRRRWPRAPAKQRVRASVRVSSPPRVCTRFLGLVNYAHHLRAERRSRDEELSA